MELSIWVDQLESNRLEEMQTKEENKEEEMLMEVEEIMPQALLLSRLLLYMLEAYHILQQLIQLNRCFLQSEKYNQLE